MNFQPVSKSKAGESEALIFTKVDTRTPMGKAMAHMAVVFAELERDLIRMRTRGRFRSRRRTASRLADQDRRQTTWLPIVRLGQDDDDRVRVGDLARGQLGYFGQWILASQPSGIPGPSGVDPLLAGRYWCLRLNASGSWVESGQQTAALLIPVLILPLVYADASKCPDGDESG